MKLKSLVQIYKMGIHGPSYIEFLPTVILVKPLDKGVVGIYVADLNSKTHIYVEAKTADTLHFLEECGFKNVPGVFNYYVGRGKQTIYRKDGFSHEVSVIQDIHESEKIYGDPSTLEIKRVAGELFEMIHDMLFPARAVI